MHNYVWSISEIHEIFVVYNHLHLWSCHEHRLDATVDRENFTLKIIRVKNFVLINFRGLFDPRNFFNGWRLHNG